MNCSLPIPSILARNSAVERRTVNPLVTGSNPVGSAKINSELFLELRVLKVMGRGKKFFSKKILTLC